MTPDAALWTCWTTSAASTTTPRCPPAPPPCPRCSLFPPRTCPLRQRLAVRPRHREPVLRQRPRPRCPPGRQPHQRRNPHPSPDRHCRTDALIDTCVISYEQGREKPDPHLFLKACADLGTDPRATLMVGDNPIRDGGAAACGLRTYMPRGRTADRCLTAVEGSAFTSGGRRGS
ncbi:HAD-IA family hydrolase [Streptomyces canus]|uniref:HAD family hydrolase n=1 Tax=Streptomyces canus TaxID=58343 RepID=UPI002E3778A9|nr:HAD-IA family hydrolase [Streptomyces canus]